MIFILGASGRIGQHWLRLALSDGHYVTALARDSSRIPFVNERLTLFQGDATVFQDLIEASRGSSTVLSALSTDKGTVLSDYAPLLVSAMKLNGIKRIVTIGTAGILNSRAEPGLLRYESVESRRRTQHAALEHHKFYNTMEQSDLDWTIVCPTYLPDGAHTGKYRIERDYLPIEGESISVADTAEFAYKQLNLTDYIGSRVGISY